MLHVRLVLPSELTTTVLLILDDAAVINLASHLGSVARPEGDLITFDLAPEAANRVIGQLRRIQVPESGSIMISPVATTLSAAADHAIAVSPGDPSESVFWENVKARVAEESRLTVTWVSVLAVAVLIAAIGLLTDSAILIVGAMAVGPDFGPVAAIAIGIHTKKISWVTAGAKSLLVGFVVAVPLTTLMVFLLEVTGNTPTVFAQQLRVQTVFVSNPDIFSVLVALLAGVAGMLSLTLSKMSSLVGVLISVTTVPAAAGIGVHAAHGQWGAAGGSAAQLSVNLVALVLAGVATLGVQRHFNTYLTAQQAQRMGRDGEQNPRGTEGIQ